MLAKTWHLFGKENAVPLNFGSFAKPIKQTTSLNNFDFVVILFRAVDSNLSFALNDTNCSKYLNSKRNLPADIINGAKDCVSTDVESYFVGSVIPVISDSQINKLITKLSALIRNDVGIASTDKQIFLSLAKTETFSTFLSTVFIYAVQQPNEVLITPSRSDMEAGTDFMDGAASAPCTFDTDSLLLAQMFSRCALCGNPLIRERNNSPVKNYAVVEIFPSQPTPSQTTGLDAVEPPTYPLTSLANKTVVCRAPCEVNYLSAFSLGDYNKLSSRKTAGAKILEATSNIPRVEMETALSDIINNIAARPMV